MTLKVKTLILGLFRRRPPALVKRRTSRICLRIRLRGIALVYLEDIDEIRNKSGHMQGRLSKTIKARLDNLRSITWTFHERATEKGDIAFLRGRSDALTRDLIEARRETRPVMERRPCAESWRFFGWGVLEPKIASPKLDGTR